MWAVTTGATGANVTTPGTGGGAPTPENAGSMTLHCTRLRVQGTTTQLLLISECREIAGHVSENSNAAIGHP